MTPADPLITDHAYSPGPITLWHADRPPEPACRVCGRLKERHAG